MQNPYHKSYVRNQKIILALTIGAIAITGAAAIVAALGLLFQPFKMWWQGVVIAGLFIFALACWSVIVAGVDTYKEVGE